MAAKHPQNIEPRALTKINGCQTQKQCEKATNKKFVKKPNTPIFTFNIKNIRIGSGKES
jgi:hypothetical protein